MLNPTLNRSPHVQKGGTNQKENNLSKLRNDRTGILKVPYRGTRSMKHRNGAASQEKAQERVSSGAQKREKFAELDGNKGGRPYR